MKALTLAVLLILTCGAIAAPVRAFGKCEQITLTFDAATLVWSASGTGCDISEQTDVNGIKTLYVDAKTIVNVSVDNINPLLYRAAIGDVTVESIEALKDLQALALLIGGGVPGLIKHSLALDIDSVTSATLKPASTDLERRLKTLKDSLRTFAGEEAALVVAIQQLEVAPRVSVGAPSKAFAAWQQEFKALRDAYAADTTSSQEVKKEAVDLLDRQGSISKSVGVAKLTAWRACVAQDKCSRSQVTEPLGTYDVERKIKVGVVSRTTEWSEIGTYPLTVQLDSPYAGSVAAGYSEKIASNFKLASMAASKFAVGVGLLNTGVRAPKWTASALDSTKPDVKTIVSAGDERRTGIKALFGSARLLSAPSKPLVDPLVEFGATLDSKAPALFAGIGVTAAKYVRLGIGVTTMQIPALDGQVANETTVADAGAIKTRDVWKGGWYWSVGVSISGLPFFTRE